MTDNVNHPAHYAGKVECIDCLESATADLVGIEAVCTANSIKYLYRWKKKNGVEDLKKARWYIDRLITKIEDEENNNSLSRDKDYIKELKALYRKISSRAIPKAGDVYRHFKGRYYEIIAVGHHSETGENMVVYFDLSGKNSTLANPCIRPLDMFMSEVDHDKYPDVTQKYRFEKVK